MHAIGFVRAVVQQGAEYGSSVVVVASCSPATVDRGSAVPASDVVLYSLAIQIT